MTEQTTVDVNFIYATITVVVAILGCVFAVKQNRKQNEEAIDKKVKEAATDLDEKTRLKIENEGLKREKLEGDMKNFHTDALLDKKTLREVSKDVDELKKNDVVHEENIKTIKDDVKEIKDDTKSTTTKVFEKLDILTSVMNSIKVEIAKK